MARYVALLDILGFKDIVEKNSHADVINLFENFRIHLQKEIAHDKLKEDDFKRVVFDVSKSTLNSNIISDSIILWTNDNGVEDFFELLDCLQRLLFFCHNTTKIFLRGGITYGDFHYDYSGVIRGENTIMLHPVMVGRALVDAYEIEKKLQIAGCVLDEKAIHAAKISNLELFNEKWQEMEAKHLLINYEMPLKKGSLKFWTLNWVSDANHPTLEELKASFSSYKKSVDSDDVKGKINNTLSYYAYVKENVPPWPG